MLLGGLDSGFGVWWTVDGGQWTCKLEACYLAAVKVYGFMLGFT